jgi:hypothetical protein
VDGPVDDLIAGARAFRVEPMTELVGVRVRRFRRVQRGKYGRGVGRCFGHSESVVSKAIEAQSKEMSLAGV